MSNSNVKEKTIERHCRNVELYINAYLLKEEPLEMKYGANSLRIDDFLGYYFIRKCMWSTPDSIKSTAASIKKFYSCMLQRGNIGESDYRELVETISENMDCWLEDCETFNNPDAANPFDY